MVRCRPGIVPVYDGPGSAVHRFALHRIRDTWSKLARVRLRGHGNSPVPTRSMFVLAHLSDPHLGPLPTPRLAELVGKRATGFLNWRRKRHVIHRGDVLARIVADLKAQAADHIAVTGDLVNISLAGEYAPARAWLASLGPPRDVTLVPGNHDAYVRAAARHPQLHWGDYMRGDDAGRDGVSVRAPARPAGADRIVDARCRRRPSWRPDASAREQIARLAEALDRCGREATLSRGADPPSADQQAGAPFQTAPRWRRLSRRAGAAWRRARHSRPRSRAFADRARRSAAPHPGRRRALGLGSAAAASTIPPATISTASKAHSGDWRCEAIWRGLARDGEAIVETKRIVLSVKASARTAARRRSGSRSPRTGRTRRP